VGAAAAVFWGATFRGLVLAAGAFFEEGDFVALCASAGFFAGPFAVALARLLVFTVDSVMGSSPVGKCGTTRIKRNSTPDANQFLASAKPIAGESTSETPMPSVRFRGKRGVFPGEKSKESTWPR
jgi:hypothetical protein